MNTLHRFLVAMLVATTLLCAGLSRGQSTKPAPTTQATVVWISIDGFRHDYLERVHPPTLWRLAHEGAFTTHERPIFPSLTFPNHVAQVTGCTADRTGIPMNAFFDPAAGKSFSFPDDGAELLAEPIWVTAKRQGLRVMTIDWPMSHAQTGEFKSDYFDETFDGKETDEHRLKRVAQLLDSDHPVSGQPLRLIMTYMSHIDTVGHRNGPDSAEIDQAVRDADTQIGQLLKTVLNWFDRNHRDQPGAELYFIITTDHGMEPVHTLVNLDRLIGAPLVQGAKLITSGPIACIYLDDLPAAQRDERAEAILDRLRNHPQMLRAWKSQDVPEELHFTEPAASSRIGQVVVALRPGFSFTSDRTATTRPAVAGPLGMHGYDPAECPNMLGSAIVWRYRHPLGGIDLGKIDNTQWYATVARLLGIEPVKDCDHRVVGQ